MSLLQMSFSGAVFIIAIVIIRAIAINKLPKKTFLVLWEIALLRLLIPFSIPSMFSVYTLISKNIATPIFSGTETGNVIPAISQENQLIAAQRATQFSTNTLLSVPVWSAVWLIGMILSAIFFIVSYLRCLKEFQTSLPIRNDYAEQWLRKCPLKRPISIRQSDRISAPLTYGIFHPVILMPKKTNWENARQLQYVLSHEYVHIYRFDTIAKLIATIAFCVHWFNPMVWVMYILFNHDIELACDESVVRQFGETSKSAYARVLIDMEAGQSGLLPFCNNFSKNAVEGRIRSIMKTKKATVGLTIGSLLLVIIIITLFVTSTQKEKMVFVSGRLFVTTNQDVSEMVMREAEASEYDSPYIGIIESTVNRAKEPDVELQSNFGSIGSEIIFNGNGIAVNLNGKWIQFEPQDLVNSSQSGITQSEKTVYDNIESKEDVAAFVKNVSDDSIAVDIIEYITVTDTERIKELNLTQEDMLDGYYFFNPDEEVTTWKCNAETVYTFIDWNGDFTGGEFPVEYTTMDIEEFQKYIETYDNGEPRMPFFFTIENGYIKQIIEKPFA